MGVTETAAHRCPGPGCTKTVEHDMLACEGHWQQVPREVRKQVYRAWDGGAGAGTYRHQKTLRLAVSHMREMP